MSVLETLYEHEELEASQFVTVPRWIEQDITLGTIAGVIEGGCDSGAYMPAVTYWQALETMNEHGSKVMGYLDSCGAPTMEIDFKHDYWAGTWAGIACKLLSAAVEYWCHGVADGIAVEIREVDE